MSRIAKAIAFLGISLAAVSAFLLPVPEAQATGYDGCPDGLSKHVKRQWPETEYHCKNSTCRPVGHHAFKMMSTTPGIFPQCVVNASCGTVMLEWVYSIDDADTPSGAPWCNSAIGSGGLNVGGSGWFDPS